MFESLKLYVGEAADIAELVRSLDKFGYERCQKVSIEGDYSLVGDTLTVYPVTFEYPVRLDIDHGEIKSIKSVDVLNFKTINEHKGAIILPAEVLRKTKVKKKALQLGENPIESFVDIEPGDHVVHIDHGIGKYLGIQRMRHDGKMNDFFVLEYKGGDKLYVDKNDLHKLQRYISFHRSPAELTSLKGKSWENTKKKAATGAGKVAKDLLILQAKRASKKAYAFKADTDWQREMEEAFPYKETPDQLKACVDVKADLERDRPMDRLLCGDVGYGKTEVALRAAFKAVMDNKQVAFLVPTTILAEQHADTFARRMKDYPVCVKMFNRFCTGAEQRGILKELAAGKVDIIIGTHRLLSNDVIFKDLGLLIIDEEQRFGVHQKEKIKRLKVNIDILTLTATPIPRTLYMALMGGKDISIIQTPPLERLPIETEIIDNDKHIIRKAILRELGRGGQTYYIHNRVDNIARVAKEVKDLVPEARVAVGHGQMSARELENAMMKFIRHDVDVLVCTTIVESGIDIPNANTMIVNNADKFGLADLYQLRGRIGRFDRQAYAYMVIKDAGSLTGEVQERLHAIKKYHELGSGFKIAMRDLEMRGAGNLLGIEQSGFIDQIGFDLYCRLLKQEIDKLGKDPGILEEETPEEAEAADDEDSLT